MAWEGDEWDSKGLSVGMEGSFCLGAKQGHGRDFPMRCNSRPILKNEEESTKLKSQQGHSRQRSNYWRNEMQWNLWASARCTLLLVYLVLDFKTAGTNQEGDLGHIRGVELSSTGQRSKPQIHWADRQMMELRGEGKTVAKEAACVLTGSRCWPCTCLNSASEVF